MMEAFERYALSGRKKPANPQVAIFHTWHDQKLAKKYWRAALEWVKREAISLDERGDANRAVINRELEDK